MRGPVDKPRHTEGSITEDLHPKVFWFADAQGNVRSLGESWLGLVRLDKDAEDRGWLSAIHPDDRSPTANAWSTSLKAGVSVDVTFRLRMKDDTHRWMRLRASPHRDGEGRIRGWLGTLEDIHQRHLAEMALQESEAFAHAFLEASDIAIEVLDLRGNLVSTNGAGLLIREVASFEAIKNQPFNRFWPDNVRPVIRDAIVSARNGKTIRHTLYGPTMRGNPRWWDISISPIYDEQGKAVRLLALSRDVTEAKQNELELVTSANRLAEALESTMDNVIYVNVDWRITYLNRRAKSVLPPELSPYPGRDLRQMFDTEAAAPFFRRFEKAMFEHSSIAFEERMPNTDAWFEVQAHGTETGLVIFFRDVSARRHAQEQVVHLATHDALTGLANRLSFREEVDAALASSPGTTIAVLSIDLDDFKLVNDTLGHRAGDLVLREVGERLRRCIRSVDAVARLGGDEFAVLLRLGRPEDAALIARSILVSLSYPFGTDGESVLIGASIGIALAPRGGASTEDVLHHADVALYQVKNDDGRNYRFFEPHMDEALQERRHLKHELVHALEREQLSLVFQPQVNFDRSRLIGFEALLRWRTSDSRLIPPSIFVPLAEESGLIDAIGKFVLEESCIEAMHWPEDVTISVNVSPVQFRTHRVAGVVAAALARSGLPANRLELEITESVLMGDSVEALKDLTDLRKLGIMIALDDFGTGYSSLGYLRKFQFDRIKIDGSFTSELPSSQESKAIVRAIIGLGRSLKARVIAEGVETWEQLLALGAEGCHEGQGYLFSQPMTARRARRLAQTGLVKPTEIAARRKLS